MGPPSYCTAPSIHSTCLASSSWSWLPTPPRRVTPGREESVRVVPLTGPPSETRNSIYLVVMVHYLLIQHHVGGHLIEPLGALHGAFDALLGELRPAHILNNRALLVRRGSHFECSPWRSACPQVRRLLLLVRAGLALLASCRRFHASRGGSSCGSAPPRKSPRPTS